MTSPRTWLEANRQTLGLPPDWGRRDYAELPRLLQHTANGRSHTWAYDLPPGWTWGEIYLPDGRIITGLIEP